MPACVLHRSRNLVVLMRGRGLDADAATYLIKRHARSADEKLRDLIVPQCFHVTFRPAVMMNAPVDILVSLAVFNSSCSFATFGRNPLVFCTACRKALVAAYADTMLSWSDLVRHLYDAVPGCAARMGDMARPSWLTPSTALLSALTTKGSVAK
jgi:hypothetical protein